MGTYISNRAKHSFDCNRLTSNSDAFLDKDNTMQQMISNWEFGRQISIDEGNSQMLNWHGAQTSENYFR